MTSVAAVGDFCFYLHQSVIMDGYALASISFRFGDSKMCRPSLSLLVLFVSAVYVGAEEKPWLDLQGCSVCKHMGAHMDLMQEVTWETHKISNGMLSASVIPKKHEAKMLEIHEEMKRMMSKLEKGEPMELCGFCTAHHELMQAGAKTEDIKTDFGMIGMLTSDDPAVVKRIHALVDLTVTEFEKYKQLMEQAGDVQAGDAD